MSPLHGAAMLEQSLKGARPVFDAVSGNSTRAAVDMCTWEISALSIGRRRWSGTTRTLPARSSSGPGSEKRKRGGRSYTDHRPATG